jgi:hypothetical protein
MKNPVSAFTHVHVLCNVINTCVLGAIQKIIVEIFGLFRTSPHTPTRPTSPPYGHYIFLKKFFKYHKYGFKNIYIIFF